MSAGWPALPGRSGRRERRLLWAWWALALLAWLALPWYLPQDLSLWASLGRAWSAADSASGLLQGLRHDRPWLLLPALGMVLAAPALALPAGRRQGRWLVAACGLALAGLLGPAALIVAQGWAFEPLNAAFGALPQGQPGIGLGAATVLLALLVLLGAGVARCGYFRGDLFVAAAVVLSAALLALFVALPVLRALAGAFQDDTGAWSAGALAERLGHERVWGLACLAGGARCGVAWNTLALALATAASTTVMGSLIALYADRGDPRLARPLKVLALLPIITPPFVVGLGLILLFGRAGLVNQALESLFGLPPTRWFYGPFGIWLAQLFSFTPVAFMIMRGVVQGLGPQLEEAAQTLRASRWTTFCTITLPLLKPGLAVPSWWASSRAWPTLATRWWWAAALRCCRPTSSLPSSGPSSTPAGRRRWR